MGCDIVYLRMKKNLELNKIQAIRLGDIAHLATSFKEKEKLEQMRIYNITKADKNIVVIDSFLIIAHLNRKYPDLEFQPLGPPQTIIRINKKIRKPSILAVAFVWLLLFIGTAMTIINFHYDVSMQQVQQKIHYIITGENSLYPLWIQVPYSIGLGVGMLLFFNHWFHKRFNEEPSPLEVEIHNYQENLDNYVSHYENKLNESKSPF